MIVDYCNTSAKTADDLSKNVRELIKEGWQPQGNVFVQEKFYGYTQTMIKRDDVDLENTLCRMENILHDINANVRQ